MKKITLCLLTLFLCFSLTLTAQVRILTIGDSTMANYDEQKNSGKKEKRGWAQMLPLFLTDDVTVDNAAKNGRSSKSFYYEFWNDLRETLKPGDYVFIQFGHNDEKADGLDTDESDHSQRGTAAWGQYQKYLGMFILDAKERGAIPILLTPIVRRLFDKNIKKITDNGLHNLTHIANDDSTMNYPLAMRYLADSLNVPLIDLTILTKGLVEKMGPEKSKQIIYANEDNTHLKAMGGIIFSELVIAELSKKNILTKYIIPKRDLAINPNNLDFGLQFIGKESIKVLSLFGNDIHPQSGSIELSTEEPFSISLSYDGNYAQKIKVEYDKKNIYNLIYVSFAPKNTGKYKNDLNLKTDSINQKIILKGEAISLANTEKFKLSWNPFLGIAGTDKNIATSFHAEGLKLVDVHSKYLYEPINGLWASGDIDLNASRYVEITLTPTKSDAYLNSLIFKLSSIGGKEMYFTALGSFSQSFSKSYTFALMDPLQEGSSKTYESNQIILVPKGETFYIRIYPWYKKEAKGKYLNIENILIEGLIIIKR